MIAGDPRRAQRVRKPLAIAAAVALVFIPAAWLSQSALSKRELNSHPQSKITSTLVLSDVTNDTGDPSFNSAFRQSIGFELQRSANVKVLPEGRVPETLTEMRKTPQTRVSPEIAREICQRTASAAFIESSLSKAGSGYLVALRARNCTAGDLLDEEQSRTAAKDDVLNQLRRLTTRLQSKSAASLATLQKSAVPLDAATTSSLEALKSFSAGRRRRYENPADGLLLFHRAIELDPEFALAYAWLGRSYADSGEQKLAGENIRQAYRLRGAASDKENFFITYNYDRGSVALRNNTEATMTECLAVVLLGIRYLAAGGSPMK